MVDGDAAGREGRIVTIIDVREGLRIHIEEREPGTLI